MARKQLDVNFFTRSAIENPWPLYDEMRAAGRVVWNEVIHGWMICGFEDCSAILNDDGGLFSAMPSDPAILPWFEAPTMISTDGADHVRLRKCLAPMFTRRAAEPWEPRVTAVVEQLLAPLAAGDSTYDLIADFTMVPTIIVAEMLGVPEERHGDFMRWSSDIVNNLAWGHETADAERIKLTAARELNAYLREEIARHRVEQPDDLLTMMIRASGDEGVMSDDELRAAAVLLLAAGYDTTAKLLSNALLAFEENPDQRALLVAHPELMPDAIEEVLRWHSTVQTIPRTVVKDMTFADTEIKAGDMVYPFVAAANRDPSRWANPDVFDVRRPHQAHFGFGYGSHLCHGAPLARLEGKVALQALLRLAPDFSLRGIDFGPSFFVRGPERGFLDVNALV